MGHPIVLPLHADGRGPLQRMGLAYVMPAGNMIQTTGVHADALKVGSSEATGETVLLKCMSWCISLNLPSQRSLKLKHTI